MKKVLLILFGISLNISNIKAQSVVNHINAIIENYKSEYTVISSENIKQEVSGRIKILNSNGDYYGSINVPISRNSEIEKFSAILYDSKGIIVKKLSKRDLVTESMTDYYTLYNDNKYKVAKLQYFSYPFYINYSYTIRNNGALGFLFYPVNYYYLKASNLELKINCPINYLFNYKVNQMNANIDSIVTNNRKTFSWKIAKLDPIYQEKFSLGNFDLYPYILISPYKFYYDGYSGNFDTWNNFGIWVNNLNKDRNILSDSTKLIIHQLTDSVQDTINKIKIIYNYFQSKTRYISIQYGIGGFQPSSAAEVENCGFGDCKALSNYMKTLLEIVNINSNYTLIGSGKNKYIKYEDFPGILQSNHAILSVPINDDTIWLECTNSEYPFGYIGENNCNRKAIIIDSSNTSIVKTPVSNENTNIRIVNTYIKIEDNGNIDCSSLLLTSGSEMDQFIYFKSLDKSLQLNAFTEMYSNGSMILKEINYSKTNDIFPKIKIDIRLVSTNSISKGIALYSLNPNIFSKFKNPIVDDIERKNDFYFESGTNCIDSIRVKISNNFLLERYPKDIKFQSCVGNFSIKYLYQQNELLCIRSFTLFRGIFSKEKNQEISDFFNKVQNADNQNIIIKII